MGTSTRENLYREFINNWLSQNQSEERIGREAPPEARPPAESRAEEKQEEMLEREAGAHEKGRSGQDVKSEESEIHNFAQAVRGVPKAWGFGH